jgi:hypothetical protein
MIMKNFTITTHQTESNCSRKKDFLTIRFLFIYLSLTILSLNSIAQGDLLVFPKRIVFDGAKTSQSINLSNSGKDTARYTVSFVQIRMKEDGSFENITKPDPNQFFADPYLRIFPRKVVLGPGEAQIVKVQLQKADQLAAGEYRSHIYFRADPDVKPLGEKEVKKDTASISVKLIPVFGITIPVIIRRGQTVATVTLSNVAFQKVSDSVSVVKMDFNRSGNSSVYGNIKIMLVAPNGKITKVAAMDGFAVYTPGAKRTCKIELKKGIDYKGGKLVITYTTPEEDKGEKLAEAELELH